MALSARVFAFFKEQKEAYPNIAERYAELQSLSERKLWHELTEALQSFVNDPTCNKNDNYIQLYEQFLRHDASQLNQLRYVNIMVAIAQQYYSSASGPENPGMEKAIELLSDISGCLKSKVKEEAGSAAAGGATKEAGSDAMDTEETPKPSGGKGKGGEEKGGAGGEEEKGAGGEEKRAAARRQELRMQKRRKVGDAAYVVAQSNVALLRLKQNKADECLYLLGQTKPVLDALECAPPVAHRAYFGTAAEYHAVYGPADDYYRNRLQYVVYTPVDELSANLRVKYAQDLCLAALVSDKIYNFGEMVSLPIFKSLKQDESTAWLSDLLECFNDGDIARFNQIFNEFEEEIKQKSALAANIEKLKQKISILCLLDLVFTRPASERNIAFAAISTATQLPVNQVEWLLMRAMSLGLMKGIIDEVAQTVNVTYIQPRVLDPTQLKKLGGKLKEWSKSVQQTVTFMESNTTELFA